MPAAAQPSKKLQPLCYEHHVDMRFTQIALTIVGEPVPGPVYTCPVLDCFVHYSSSHGYYLAPERGPMELDMRPGVNCPDDGQPMYLAKTNPNERSFRLWKCPQCHATSTNDGHYPGGAS